MQPTRGGGRMPSDFSYSFHENYQIHSCQRFAGKRWRRLFP
jgi:hypothetical protein